MPWGKGIYWHLKLKNSQLSMMKVLFSYLSFQGLLISLKVEKFDCSSLEILTWHHLGVFWLQRMCYLLKSGHWGKIWLLTFWTLLNDGTEVFQTVMIQHCLKIQWEKMAAHRTLHIWNSLGIHFKCSSQVCFLQNAVFLSFFFFLFLFFKERWIRLVKFLQLGLLEFCVLFFSCL